MKPKNQSFHIFQFTIYWKNMMEKIYLMERYTRLGNFQNSWFSNLIDSRRIIFSWRKILPLLVFLWTILIWRIVKNQIKKKSELNFVNFVDINLDSEVNPKTKYNLLANICHEGKPKGGFYKIHVKHKALNQWYFFF